MKALILCAGLGTRLGVLTNSTPKALLPIGGEPLLAHTLRWLYHNGFYDIAINIHFGAEQFKPAIGDGSRFGVSIHWERETALLGTAGSVKNLAWFAAGEDAFLVVYGDLLINQDLAPMIAHHRAHDAAATLLVHKRAGSNSIIETDSTGRVTRFLERPEAGHATGEYWVNSGVQLLGPRMVSRIPDKQPCDLPADLYVPFLAQEHIQTFQLSGYRCAIDSPERYREAEKENNT